METKTEKNTYANRHLEHHLEQSGIPVSETLRDMIRSADFSSDDDRAALRAEIEKTPQGKQYLVDHKLV